MQAVLETLAFRRDAKAAGIGDGEREAIIDAIATNPKAGDVIPGTGGARKIRFAGRGKGKRGGYRVVTYYGGGDIPVFMLSVFSKGDRVDLSQAERNELRVELAGAAAAYRKGAKR